MHLIPRYQVRKELMSGMQVELMDAVHQRTCGTCGAVLRTDIPDMPGLMAAVAVKRAKIPFKLNGDEIRFLRKEMGLSAKELAEKLHVSDETVSRWENGHLVIGDSIERIFRWKVCKALEERTMIKWNDNEILSQMKIIPVSAEKPVLVFYRANRPERWKERQLKVANAR